MTERQAECLHFIEAFIAENGYSPSFRQIADALGISSLSAVQQYVDALAAHGKITRVKHRARSIEIVRDAA